MKRARVLAITSELPWPLDSGGHLRTFYLLRALTRVADVRLVCPCASEEGLAGLRTAIKSPGFRLLAVPVAGRTWSTEAQRAAAAIVAGEPYVMFRRHWWKAVSSVLASELATDPPDVMYLDHLDSFSYRRATVPTVIDLHNIYSRLVDRMAEEETGPRRFVLRREGRLLARVESRAAEQCDALFAVSDAEADYFRAGGGSNVHTIPNGVNCADFDDLPTGREGPPCIAFVGTMSWAPNASAARFLAKDVMPVLRLRLPQATLRIIGRRPPREITDLHGADGVEVLGMVPSVKPHLLEASVLAVPLNAGGGTRLKILEAFAAGLPVVSTSIGAEGIDAIAGTHYFQADRAQFADVLVKTLLDRRAGTDIAANARRLVHARYDWDLIGRKASDVVLSLCRA